MKTIDWNSFQKKKKKRKIQKGFPVEYNKMSPPHKVF